jgi:hypothetical protein
MLQIHSAAVFPSCLLLATTNSSKEESFASRDGGSSANKREIVSAWQT